MQVAPGAYGRVNTNSHADRAVAKLYFSYSAMNAGKSTLLLQASHNYRERGMRTLLFIAPFVLLN